MSLFETLSDVELMSVMYCMVVDDGSAARSAAECVLSGQRPPRAPPQGRHRLTELHLHCSRGKEGQLTNQAPPSTRASSDHTDRHL